MAQNIAARADKDHREALDDMVEDGHADSRSEALRQTSQASLARMGYLNGTTKDTTLRQTVREFARLFVYGGFAWFAFTVLWSVEVRLAGMVLVTFGVALLGADRLLAQVEPSVTKRLHGLLSREKA